MLKTVIKKCNDTVMFFDESGEEIPEYQSNYDIAKDKIIRAEMLDFVLNHWHSIALEPRNTRDEMLVNTDPVPCMFIPLC